jgi:hypothetical protein
MAVCLHESLTLAADAGLRAMEQASAFLCKRLETLRIENGLDEASISTVMQEAEEVRPLA